jgi:uncharacterized protein YndB with AHSA1/START domain
MSDVAVELVVDRPPMQVWEAVSDPARIAAYSPEAAGVTASTSPTGPLPVGASFRGSNRNGLFRWSTRCTVVESAPGQAFAFDVSYLGLAVARWRFVLTADGSGTLVVQEWTDHRGAAMKALGTIGTGVADRRTHNERTMRATLDALKSDLEAT